MPPSRGLNPLVQWLLGIGAILITASVCSGVGVLWAMKGEIGAITSQLAALNERVAALENTVNNRTLDRYTGTEATRDRTATMAVLAELTTRLSAQESRTVDLLTFKARAEERLRLEGK